MVDLITRERLRAWDACYSDEKIAELVPVEGLSPLAVCDLQTVTAADRLWVLLREEIIPARELRLLACDWADQALAYAGSADPRCVAAIAVSRRYADGEATREELAAARVTAYAPWAARTAANHTASAATRMVTVPAANHAASAAADVTAWAAADAAADPETAAWQAAFAAEREQLLTDVRRILTSEK